MAGALTQALKKRYPNWRRMMFDNDPLVSADAAYRDRKGPTNNRLFDSLIAQTLESYGMDVKSEASYDSEDDIDSEEP